MDMYRFDVNLTVYPSSPGRDEKAIFFPTECRTAVEARRRAIDSCRKNGLWVRRVNFCRRFKIHDP